MADYSKVVHIYVDEYGTPDLGTDKAGNEEYFVYAAVIIANEDIDNAHQVYNKIIADDFRQQGYIKSAYIPKDRSGYVKTISSLTTLKQLRHHVFALIVDKAAFVKHPGLSIKQVFLKFIQRLLAEHFYNKYDEFHIYADETGWPEFKTSLEAFMRNTVGLTPTLFSNNTIQYCDDKENKLVQFADLYAGVIGKYFCGKYDETRAKTIHDTIRTKISIQWVPQDTISFVVASNDFDGAFDDDLFKLSLKTGEEYLELNQEDKSGCELIKYMLQEAHFNPMRHISSKEIKERLLSKRIDVGDPIVKVSELRDKGVLIISPIGKKGYKFPTSEKEIAEFYNRLSANIVPQLKRGYILNEVLKERSVGKYNVLDDPSFEVLYELTRVINNHKRK